MEPALFTRTRIVLILIALWTVGCAQAAEEAVVIPAPAYDEPASDAAPAAPCRGN